MNDVHRLICIPFAAAVLAVALGHPGAAAVILAVVVIHPLIGAIGWECITRRTHTVGYLNAGAESLSAHGRGMRDGVSSPLPASALAAEGRHPPDGA